MASFGIKKVYSAPKMEKIVQKQMRLCYELHMYCQKLKNFEIIFFWSSKLHCFSVFQSRILFLSRSFPMHLVTKLVVFII